MLKRKVTILLLFVMAFGVAGQKLSARGMNPKREFRGVWIATIHNIDWPSKPGLDAGTQQRDMIQLLDNLERIGINNIIIQVRPTADALYAKTSEPWSYWLTGQLGRAPTPYYQPLEFIIQEAHKRAMDVHAWINPFRAVQDVTSSKQPRPPILEKHPEWFLKYDKQILFNPGLPEARYYIIEIVKNLVVNYDLDGVHFDDYFYPYPSKGHVLQDGETFKQHNPQHISSIEDWRRNNVNEFVRQVYREIKQIKPYVKFGISPFGIWRNESEDPAGSATRGLSSYSSLSADSRLWLRNGWVDYIAPQLYFYIGQSYTDFTTLLKWWKDNAYGRHVYVGLAAYKVGTSRTRWRAEELYNQVKVIRTLPNADALQGEIYYNTSSLVKNPLSSTVRLREMAYNYKALNPTMPWLGHEIPLMPKNLIALRGKGYCKLSWEDRSPKPNGGIKGYVVYRFAKDDRIDVSLPQHILKIVYNQKFYVDTTVQAGRDYVYVVTAIDRLHNESVPNERVHVHINL